MKSVNFDQVNQTTQASGEMLYTYRNDTEQTTCWEAGLLDRLKFLFTGKMWLKISGTWAAPHSVRVSDFGE